MTTPDYLPTMPNMVRHIGARYGEKDALIRGPRRLTYAELERESALIARGMLAQGLGKGSRIGLLMPNSPDWVAMLLAIMRIGGVAVPMSTLYQAPEMRYVLGHADICTLVIAGRYLRHDYLERLEAALPGLAGQARDRLALPSAPYLRSIVVWNGADQPPDRPWASAGPEVFLKAARALPAMDEAMLQAAEANVTPADPCCIIYTSGSTAEPKGVVHLNGAFIRHSYQMANDYWPFLEGDRIASVRPFFWVAGLSATLFHSLHLGACLIYPEPDTPAEIRRLIETEGVTGVSGTGGWMGTVRTDEAFADGEYRLHQVANDCCLLAARQADGGYALVNPRLEKTIGAAALPLPLDRLPRNFGMTEALGAHTAEPAPALIPEDKRGAFARPVPGVHLKIVDRETRRPLPPGEIGELLVSGYSLMDGLYKRERSQVFTADGFYPTGDLCVLDEDGFLTFTGRAGDMVKVHGANVAPLEVESHLNAMPEVEESAVVGLPIGGGDSLLVAAVTPRGAAQLTEAELIERLKPLLSSFKVPKRIVFMGGDELPKTGSGKIKKAALAALLAPLAETQAAS
ncbi:MAG: acyl--CoA ligase [Caulobacteraceae bacterium]|nr:acyl--CoA ligase [Caulobacteraceae bacterium]